ncbi:lambda-exonuclease family protein [Candidatus Endomicrobiellum devescovinae]|jgi:putative phage-type endonuclease|uniref:lambda-exonuclease family protein n=1 Tax=Candidatus Endomicrobiellum devescovinae TaxID=3242322 RepID=UPI002818B606|nr:YqaJ viral recombinase family protein [Endomicrobium sp.]
MDRSTWLKERQKGIGGSEAAAILGLNPYMTNVELWEYKTGRKVKEDKDSPFMKYGRDSEPHLIELFKLDYPKYNVIVPQPYSIQRNAQYNWMLVTVDAELNMLRSAQEPSGSLSLPDGFLEIETSNIFASRQNEKWDERVPDNYYIQILHYFLVNDKYQYCYLKAQLKSSFNKEVRLITKHYYWERKDVEEDLKYLKEKEIEFWERNVKKDVRPNLVLPPI